MSTIPTSEKLALSLEALGDPTLDTIIARSREGYYDDYKTHLLYPKSALMVDLQELGHEQFADRVLAGEFDGTLAESQEWINSMEGQAILTKITKVQGYEATG